MKALANYIQSDLDRLLPPNPLDKDYSEERVVLIFDGLDELAMQGKVGAEIAKDFVQEVQTKLNRHNHSKLWLQVILSGRDLVVQANSSALRGDRQVLHMLPYFVDRQRVGENYIDGQNLLKVDQREQWWKNYGEVSGKGYGSMPQELQRKNLTEITAQPLLNYLLALSYQRQTLVFSETTNLNEIYEDLLNAVYARGWEAKRQHRAIANISNAEFLRILEEVAMAAWHGNGRTTTIQDIQKHFDNNKSLKSLLTKFETGAEAGVTRLLTAFYFRQQGGIQNGEKTFEFTHKSFGEYLTAKAIVRGVERIQKQLELHAEDCELGWDEREALKFWAELCGKSAIDDYLHDFIRDEIQLRGDSAVQKWQQTFCRLIEVMLGYGMPMERLTPRLSYQAECHQARNAEEALLSVLSSCSMKTKQLSTINWDHQHAFEYWLDRLRGQQVSQYVPLAFMCLVKLSLDGLSLSNLNLYYADLSGADLSRADLSRANLDSVSLVEANLSKTNLIQVSLIEANLSRANLSRAELVDANLSDANLSDADLSGADLDGADLCGANLDGANLDGATLNGTYLSGISWDDRTSWKNVGNLENAYNVPEALTQLLGMKNLEL